jgi:hypothetical protein
VFGSTGDWTQGTGTLVLSVAAGQTMAAGTTYKLSFELLNSLTEQNEGAVTPMVSASGSATAVAAPMREELNNMVTSASTTLTAAVDATVPRRYCVNAIVSRCVTHVCMYLFCEPDLWVIQWRICAHLGHRVAGILDGSIKP